MKWFAIVGILLLVAVLGHCDEYDNPRYVRQYGGGGGRRGYGRQGGYSGGNYGGYGNQGGYGGGNQGGYGGGNQGGYGGGNQGGYGGGNQGGYGGGNQGGYGGGNQGGYGGGNQGGYGGGNQGGYGNPGGYGGGKNEYSSGIGSTLAGNQALGGGNLGGYGSMSSNSDYYYHGPNDVDRTPPLIKSIHSMVGLTNRIRKIVPQLKVKFLIPPSLKLMAKSRIYVDKRNYPPVTNMNHLDYRP